MTVTNGAEPSVYSDDHAEVYDAIHAARGRDWAAEANQLADLIRRRNPAARSLLDIACGTGEHLRRFRELFDRVEGLEASAGMRRIAARKLPGVPLHGTDMREIRLDEPVDAITCMCFSICYLPSVPEMRRAVSSMAANLTPGGVLVLEPWWFPERFLDGFVTGSVAQENGRVISRVSHSVRANGRTRMTVRYTVADATGIRDFTEQEVLSLFARDDYLAALREAGLAAEYREGPPNGRGLFVGVRQ